MILRFVFTKEDTLKEQECNIYNTSHPLSWERNFGSFKKQNE